MRLGGISDRDSDLCRYRTNARAERLLRPGLCIRAPNAPNVSVKGAGTIDSGYTGPMFALLRTFSDKPVQITRGMRVCQIIPLSLFPVNDRMFEVDAMPDTPRGTTGFGSTGDSAKHV